MPKQRKVDPDLLRQAGAKKFVRYDEGAVLYSMGVNSFRELAKEAGAVYKIKRVVLVNTELIDAYLENYRVPDYN